MKNLLQSIGALIALSLPLAAQINVPVGGSLPIPNPTGVTGEGVVIGPTGASPTFPIPPGGTSYDVPNDPALKGLSFQFCAWIPGNPPEFLGCVTVNITC